MTSFYKLSCVSILSLVSADCTLLSVNKPYDCAHGSGLIVHMKDLNTHKEVGTITISSYMHDGKQEGMLITPHLCNLPANTTSWYAYIHINPSCEYSGMAASGHWDPDNTQKHLGPYKMIWAIRETCL